MLTWDEAYKTKRGVRWWPETALATFIGGTFGALQKGEKHALDVGCGTGRNMWLLFESGFTVHGMDSSKEAVICATEYLQSPKRLGMVPLLRHATLPDIPFEGKFDLVVDCQTMQHVKHVDVPFALEEICRVLDHGGMYWYMFWVGTPQAADKIYGSHYPELGWITQTMWEHFITGVGFELVKSALWTREYPEHGEVAEWIVGSARKP